MATNNKYLVSDKSGDHLPYTGDDGKPDHGLTGAGCVGPFVLVAAVAAVQSCPSPKPSPKRLPSISPSAWTRPAAPASAPDAGGRSTIGSFTVHPCGDAHKRWPEKGWGIYLIQVAAGVTVTLFGPWLKDWLVALFGLPLKHWHH